MDAPFIPFHIPSIGNEEIQEVTDALRSGWLTSGPRTAQFEEEFRRYVQAQHALALNSCTAALHLALAALGVGPGDEVITTPITFCATVNTILHVGATPVLADIDATGNIDPGSIAERITERTRAVIPVHLGGLPCDMDRIWGLAQKHGLAVIEDAAHAIGAWHRGLPVGSNDPAGRRLSDAVAFSFYATKNLTTGEGGMITTPDRALLDRMRILALHGISKDAWNRYSERGKWYYEVLECGFKYNLSDIQSAIGIHQLRKLERFIQIRTRYAQMYNDAFRDLDEVETPPDDKVHRHAWHLYMLRLNLDLLDIDRGEFIAELHRRNIGASVHFIPIPHHPAFSQYPKLAQDQCPRAMELYPRLVSLPLYPAMNEQQVEYVARMVKEIVTGRRRQATVSHGAEIRPTS